MKKIKYSRLFLVIAFLSAHLFAVAQKNEKAKLTYDTAAKVLYRTRLIEVTEVIDTARLYAEKTRLLSEIDRLNMQLDSTNAQIKEARKLMNKKKGGGNNRTAEMPTPPAAVPTETPKPKKTKKQ